MSGLGSSLEPACLRTRGNRTKRGKGFSLVVTNGDASLVGGGGSSEVMMIELSQNEEKEDTSYNRTPCVRV